MVTLDRADCLRLLGGGVIGRVIYTDGAMPAARPVNYALVGEEIIFRTGGELAAATINAIVAFEVDESTSPSARAGVCWRSGGPTG